MRIFNYPKWFKVLYPKSVWGFYLKKDKIIYLTFDDGPIPEATEWVLDTLDEYNAKATFFCLGQNAKSYPYLVEKIVSSGHSVGNHSNTHLNGFKTKTEHYVKDVLEAEIHIPSKLFRPPYGRIKRGQFKKLKEKGFQVIFWSHLTYDFDPNISKEILLKNVKRGNRSGDILVFHDSLKAIENVKAVLPETLRYFKKEGYTFKGL